MMNMSEDCSVLDPLMYHPESRWISEAFIGDNEGLARVLRISPSDTSSSGAFHDIHSSSYPLPVQHQLDPPSLADAVCRRVNPLGPQPAARVSKRLRRSRPSKRSPTTYIKADPANFREMVQWVTGVRLGDEEPGEPPMLPAVAARNPSQQLFLPTLDTSAVFLGLGEPVPVSAGSLVPPTSDFDSLFPGFPTLESWGVM
nr:PREDICTED: calmodulin-binding protein 25-like [Musa acuminata subsp. malaccensis]